MTEPYCQNRLFLPIKGKQDISKLSVSRWISYTIKLSYRKLPNKYFSFLKIKAHEVRALSSSWAWGWSGGAKVSCILCHRGVQLILAYSWARPAILVAGKGRGGMFLFLLFLHFHSCSSFFPVPLSSLRLSLLSLFSLSLGDDTK